MRSTRIGYDTAYDVIMSGGRMEHGIMTQLNLVYDIDNNFIGHLTYGTAAKLWKLEYSGILTCTNNNQFVILTKKE